MFLCAAPAHAQRSAATIEADLQFARGLASKWSFVDLAEEVIQSVSGGRLDSEQSAALDLLRCEIFSVGARAERDPMRRNELFEQSLTCLDGYISANPYAANRGDAEESFVQNSQFLARSLELALEDAIGEEATALNTRRIEVLEGAVRRTSELIDSVSAIPAAERTEKQVARLFELKLSLGQIYATISGAQKDDPFFKKQAEEVLVNLVFDAGEGTQYALRAYAALGDVYAANGEYGEAASYYDGVADQVIPFDAERREAEGIEWSKLPQPQKQRRFLFVELAMPGILKSYRGTGELEVAVVRCMYFWNLHRKDALDLSQFGFDALLQVARVMLASDGYLGGDLNAGTGEWFATEEERNAKYRQGRQQKSSVDFALELANQVAKDAPSNAQKIEAGKLIAEISRRPGVRISAAQLFKAATAKHGDKDFAGARVAVNELLVRLDSEDPAVRTEFGAGTYNLLGKILREDGRDLEAAMAFREGAVNWSDPEFNELNARSFQFLVGRLVGPKAEDPELRALRDEAERLLIEKSSGPVGSIHFNQGKRAQQQEKWAEAIEAYGQVDTTDEDYELAFVNQAVCMSRAGQIMEARTKFETYLTEVRTAPERATESPSALSRRRVASATAEFYRGYLDHEIAKARAKKDPNDLEGFRKVIESLVGFAGRYGDDQPNFTMIAMTRLTDSYARLGDAEAAQAQLDAMVEKFPAETSTAKAAQDLFKLYQSKHLELGAAKAPREQLAAMERSMARTLAVQNRIVAKPNYNSLRTEASLWFGLSEWTTAKAVLARIVERFYEDPDEKTRNTVQRIVVPELGYCMLQLRELNAAKDLLAPVAMGENTTKSAVAYFSMAVVGWLEGGASGVKAVPGAGGTEEEFKFITEKYAAILRSGGPSFANCQWYEDKLAEMYTFYIWGQTDSRKQSAAKEMLDGALVFLSGDSTFEAVERFCTTDGDVTEEQKARLGNGTLRARYQWLYSKTR